MHPLMRSLLHALLAACLFGGSVHAQPAAPAAPAAAAPAEYRIGPGDVIRITATTAAPIAPRAVFVVESSPDSL